MPTVGIVGLGRIGGAMARRCKAGGMDLLVFDPYATDEQIETVGARRVEFTELLKKADLVSIHAPSTPATRHIFNADTLALLKPDAILINTSRGR